MKFLMYLDFNFLESFLDSRLYLLWLNISEGIGNDVWYLSFIIWIFLLLMFCYYFSTMQNFRLRADYELIEEWSLFFNSLRYVEATADFLPLTTIFGKTSGFGSLSSVLRRAVPVNFL